MSVKDVKFSSVLNENIFFVKMLRELGISSRYLGFYFLIDILDMLINKKMVVKSFSKEVYPIIAQKYNMKECTIERNIRNLIDKSWSQKIKHKVKGLWFNQEKPTCCKFIYIVKNYIVMQIV